MINNELLNKDPNVVLEQSPFVILDRKPAICISHHGKDTKHTRHISRIIYFVINVEEWILHKTVWYEWGLQLTYIVIKNF